MFFEITYLSNSGFILSDGTTAMVFDYQGDCPNQINPTFIQANRQTVFFVSHSHADHFSPSIYEFAELPGVYYVLSSDVPQTDFAASAHQFTILSPGQQAQVCGYQVRAFGSTDQGVSFLIQGRGATIFHAGDLNNWHWKDESTSRYVQGAQQDFDAGVSQLPLGMDIAFFPVDPRMGTDYALGALQFAARLAPQVLIPMHFRQDVFAPMDFQKALAGSNTDVVPLVQTGQTCRIEVDTDA
jgi:L-ascorbate metabolism protein UlaG (beta-lactamase superfamily)